MLAPFVCPMGTRQLFTSKPSSRTEHEPHSPSPYPSFVPVNPSSFRSTSSNLSMGWTSTLLGSPLIVNDTSPFAAASGEGFMRFLAREKKHLAQETRAPERQKDLRAITEWNGNELRSRLP